MKKILIFTLLLVPIMEAQSIVVAPAKKRQGTSWFESPSQVQSADSFVKCGDSSSYDNGNYPTGEGCVFVKTTSSTKDGDWLRTDKKTTTLISYRSMVKNKGEFVGIQLMNIYDSNGRRTPLVYVFYNARKKDGAKTYYLECGSQTEEKTQTPSADGCLTIDNIVDKNGKVTNLTKIISYQDMVKDRGEYIGVKHIVKKLTNGVTIPATQVLFKAKEDK